MRTRNLTRALVIFLCGMLAIHGFLLWRVRDVIAKGYPDFTSFYMAGKMIRHGLGHELYDLAAEWRVQQEFAPWVTIREAALPYMHAPFEALIFAPFTYLPYAPAFLLWDGVNLLILLFLPFLLRPHLPLLQALHPLLILAAELAYFPVFFVLLQGQDTILLLLFYSLAFVSLKQRKQGRAGVWLGLGLFRFHLILPFVLILFLSRKYRLVGGFTLTAFLLAGVSAWLVGWRTFLHYPGYIWWLEQHKSRTILTPSDTTNLRGLLDTFLGQWVAPQVLLTIVVLLSVVTLLLALKSWRLTYRHDLGCELAFSITLLATVLVGYHSFIYDLALMLIPVAITVDILLTHGTLSGAVRASLAASMLALFCTPLYFFLWFRAGHPNLMALFLVLWLGALVLTMSRIVALKSANRGPQSYGLAGFR